MKPETVITLDADCIRACLKVAPKKDARYYLNGVHIELQPERVIYVATSGHVLLACDSTIPESKREAAASLPRAFILDRAGITTIKPGEKLAIDTVTDKTVTGQRFGGRGGAAPFVCALLDGKFPDWRRVIPHKLSGVLAQFNPYLLAAVADAFQELGGPKCGMAVFHNGDGPGVAQRPGAVAVITPVREDSVPDFDAIKALTK